MTTQKRKALITGSSSGIGRAISEHLLAAGWSVVGLARAHDKFVPEHPGYVPEVVDLGDLTHLSGQLRTLLKKHADVSAVVSNAGRPAMGALEGFSPNQIRAAIDINLVSHMLLAKEAAPHLKRIGGGDLIFMGSEASLQGARKGALYCAAKFGLRGFAQSLRPECASRGVRVTIVNPGMVRSPFFDALDFGPGPLPEHAIEVADVANVVYTVLAARPGTVIDEINMSPLQHVLEFTGRNSE